MAFFRPFRALGSFVERPPGLRSGLYSCAAPRLFGALTFGTAWRVCNPWSLALPNWLLLRLLEDFHSTSAGLRAKGFAQRKLFSLRSNSYSITEGWGLAFFSNLRVANGDALHLNRRSGAPTGALQRKNFGPEVFLSAPCIFCQDPPPYPKPNMTGWQGFIAAKKAHPQGAKAPGSEAFCGTSELVAPSHSLAVAARTRSARARSFGADLLQLAFRP